MRLEWFLKRIRYVNGHVDILYSYDVSFAVQYINQLVMAINNNIALSNFPAETLPGTRTTHPNVFRITRLNQRPSIELAASSSEDLSDWIQMIESAAIKAEERVRLLDQDA